MELLNTLGARFFGSPSHLNDVAKKADGKKHDLGTIVGMINQVDVACGPAESDRPFIEFSGEFLAQANIDGEQAKSKKAIIPGPVTELLFEQLKREGLKVEDGKRKGKATLLERYTLSEPIEIAIHVGVRYNPSSVFEAKYMYTSENAIEPAKASPLDSLMSRARTPLLADQAKSKDEPTKKAK